MVDGVVPFFKPAALLPRLPALAAPYAAATYELPQALAPGVSRAGRARVDPWRFYGAEWGHFSISP